MEVDNLTIANILQELRLIKEKVNAIEGGSKSPFIATHNNSMREIHGLSEENFFLLRLEDLYFQLRKAILNHSLEYPELDMFERYLLKIKDASHIQYIMGLLRKANMLINPTLFFDKQFKKDVPQDVILSRYLTTYSGNKVSISELNKNAPTPLIMRHFQSMEMTLKEEYGQYFRELWTISKSVCLKHSIELGENFVLVGHLTTKYPTSVLENVFDVLVNDGYIKGTKEEKATFLSMFSTSVNAAEEPIRLVKMAKNGNINVSFLYVLFTKLLCKKELSGIDKEIICRFFALASAEERLAPDSIKPRTKSKGLMNLENQLNQLLK